MRRTLPYALSVLLAAGACGPTQVIVTVEIDVADPDGDGMVPLALSDLEVQLIPYDRDDDLHRQRPGPGRPVLRHVVHEWTLRDRPQLDGPGQPSV